MKLLKIKQFLAKGQVFGVVIVLHHTKLNFGRAKVQELIKEKNSLKKEISGKNIFLSLDQIQIKSLPNKVYSIKSCEMNLNFMSTQSFHYWYISV